VSDVPFVLDPRPDLADLKARLEASGRVHIPNILSNNTAHALYDYLSTGTDWDLALNNGGKVYDLKRAQIEALKPAEFDEMATGIERNARSQFQYVYDAFRVSSTEHHGLPTPPLFKRLLDFMNAEAFLQFARELTGEPRIVHVNMKASRYRAGHFLTAHDDGQVASRLYAYVLNLTPTWLPDWGGLLLFHSDDGHVLEGFTPAFNALNVFKVPAHHSVTMVTPSATKARYSFTGWMLSEAPPKLA
jgi:SM-20-related protein